MKKYTLLALAVMTLTSLMASTAYAVTSQLTQQILPTECILTTVNTGSGPEVVAECPTDTPVITEVTTTPAGTRVVRGVVDGSRVATLRVIFLGITYTAGLTNSPLVLVGDSWTFFIDAISPTTPAGTYSITVEAVTIDGNTESITEMITIPSLVSVSPDPGYQPGNPSNPAQGFTEGAPQSSGQIDTLPDSPLHFDTDILGNRRIWIDRGSGISQVLVQTMSPATKGILTAVAVAVVVIGQVTVTIAGAFIQSLRR